MGEKLLPEGLFASQVAQIRAKESKLLSDNDLQKLMQSESYEECLRLLRDRGWGSGDDLTAENLLRTERENLWKAMRGMCNEQEMHTFDIFRLPKDYHNFKAAIKEAYVQKEVPNIYLEGGTLPVEKIKAAAASGEFSGFSSQISGAASQAREVLFHTGDSQMCDVILDRAALFAMKQAAKESGNELLKEYAELKCVAANINIAIRACKAKKNMDFLQKAFAECDSISVSALMAAATEGIDAIYAYLEKSSYADALEAIKESPAAFDRWCDNRIITMIRPQKYNPFTISPLAAYVVAKENEIKSVKIILSGKINQLPEEKVKERLRESYV
ncbi:MAG: V-type ATPase subunit [Lachnospiraceae bacterium]|nr:V-type ATPase subunit [Lachnospiraceae bacterium]